MAFSYEFEFDDPKNWPVEDDVHLLYSTLDNKPVGIDKHFQMSIIWSRFTSNSNKMVSSDILWKKLNSWYNLQSLDDFEILPFNVDEEDFQLPVEIIPEYILKNISDDEKKNVDFSGIHKKYISVVDTDDDDFEKSHFKLRGSEKMKWFEHPQYYKVNDKLNKKTGESKVKSELDDSLNSSNSETKKVIRQYGKAGEVSTGSLLTVDIPSTLFDEFDDNAIETDISKEDNITIKKELVPTEIKNENEKLMKVKRKRNIKKQETLTMDSENNEHSIPVKQSTKIIKSVESAASVTRSRKGSSIAQETSFVENEKVESSSVISDENQKNPRRRFSQRVSSTSESKSDIPIKCTDVSNKQESKRKCVSRK